MNHFRFERSYRGPLQGVILDWAGTTVDFGCMAPAAVFVEVFKQQGVPITMEQAREPMGLHKKDHIRTVAKMPAVTKRWREQHGRLPTEADVEAMFEDFIPRQLACITQHADLIPGTNEVMAEVRQRGLKIGTTTGYNAQMMALVMPEAKKQGYEPDEMVCVSDVPQGRPAPWMCFENAQRLGVYPMPAIAKIGDTVADISEGLNAGQWTIGVAVAGNEVGLPQQELEALDDAQRQELVARAYERLYRGGAHYVVDSIADILPCLDDIEQRLRSGKMP